MRQVPPGWAGSASGGSRVGGLASSAAIPGHTLVKQKRRLCRFVATSRADDGEGYSGGDAE